MRIEIRLPTVPLNTNPDQLQVVDCSHPDFESAWGGFLSNYPQYGFRYQLPAWKYYKMLSRSGGEDLSFAVLGGGVPVAICPLHVETIDGEMRGSVANGGPIPIALFNPNLGAKQKRALELFVHEECVRLLTQKRALQWWMDADFASVDTDEIEDLPPSRFGILDLSFQGHVMDLTLPETELWSQIRHSSKSTINQGLKLYGFKVYDQETYSDEVGERHRELHHKCSGRVTRPLETFHQMNSWIRSGCGLMFEQSFEGRIVQMILVATGKQTACGASAADDPDFKPKIPLTHSMNFFIYQECIRRGIRAYDVGETTYRDSLFRFQTYKEKTICDFKRGFGKKSVPIKRWVWFASEDEEIRFLDRQLATYKAHLAESRALRESYAGKRLVPGVFRESASKRTE